MTPLKRSASEARLTNPSSKYPRTSMYEFSGSSQNMRGPGLFSKWVDLWRETFDYLFNIAPGTSRTLLFSSARLTKIEFLTPQTFYPLTFNLEFHLCRQMHQRLSDHPGALSLLHRQAFSLLLNYHFLIRPPPVPSFLTTRFLPLL